MVRCPWPALARDPYIEPELDPDRGGCAGQISFAVLTVLAMAASWWRWGIGDAIAAAVWLGLARMVARGLREQAAQQRARSDEWALIEGRHQVSRLLADRSEGA